MSNILVVDDSATVRNEVVNFLSKHGLEADTAIDGEDAFDKLSVDNNYKLAIIDINMPNLDGLSLVEKVRAELNLDGLNIIMLTTEFETSKKERGKKAGIKGWMIKPFNGDKVIGAIKKMAS